MAHARNQLHDIVTNDYLFHDVLRMWPFIVCPNFKRCAQVPPSPNIQGIYEHMRASGRCSGRTVQVGSCMRGRGAGWAYPNAQVKRGRWGAPGCRKS